ncbi:MAG: NUDIX domain-containing protein [Patescibacteria group bacterium]
MPPEKSVPRRGAGGVYTEFSAGGVLFRQVGRKIDVAFMLDPFHKWTFPKGHIEEGETPGGAALREASEELGVHPRDLRLEAPLGKMSFWFKQSFGKGRSPKGSTVKKFVHYFLFQVRPNIRFHPRKKEKIKGVRWVPLFRVTDFSSYENMKPIVVRAMRYLYARQACPSGKVEV